MEKKNFINAELVKSNKSFNKVWMITTEGWEPKFCKNAAKALKYIFMLKRSTGRYVSNATLESLKLEIALRRDSETPLTHLQQQMIEAMPPQLITVPAPSKADPKPVSRRKPRKAAK